MDLQLANKLALISGSTAGIGYAIAETLVQEGARVIVSGRTQEAVDTAVAKLSKAADGIAIGFAGDLTTPEAAAELARRHPDVEILVNNLGIYERKAFEEIADADWQRLFDVNVMSGVRLTRAYLGGMRKRNWGRIIFISSDSAVQIPVDMLHYGMTKAAQIAIARGLAEAVAGTGITVNSVLPGPTRSRGVVSALEGHAKAQGKTVSEIEAGFMMHARPTSLIRRFATPQEVATLVAYIASPLAATTTGAALRVEGGILKSAF